MAVFDVSPSVIADAAGLIQGSTDITPDMLAELETTLEGMDLGPLLGLWLQSSVIGLTMQIMGIIIFVLVYGRMIEIYLMTSLALLPVATLSNRELGGTGPVSYTHLGLLSPRLTTGTRQAWQRRQGFYRYLNVAALPCSLIPTPPDDEQLPGTFSFTGGF